MRTVLVRSLMSATLVLAACGSSTTGSTTDGGSGTTSGTTYDCALMDNTTATSTVNNGCALLDRDTSSCQSASEAQGLSGAWLKFSCRVSLQAQAGAVQISTDSQPDYKSNYFTPSDPCHEVYTTAFPDPSLIAAESIVMSVPQAPGGSGRQMGGLGVIGVAVNGVSIFSNQAAPGDDIYTEAGSFDQCQGHPNKTAYHYHTEPYSISYDDSNLVGVMRDGSFIYGRKDADGSTPTLDSYGGHTGTTPDSATPVYHYHVNQQTSTNSGTAGQSQWFLTKGSFKAAPGSCTGCGDMR